MPSPFQKAEWITCPRNNGGRNVYSAFYETITVKENGAPVLRIAAFSDYCVYENGQPILPLSGQFACYEEEPVYDEIPLSGILAPGKHELKIVLYTVGDNTSTHRKTPHALICEITDGDDILAFSSEKTLSEPEAHYVSGDPVKVTGQLGFSFRFDARGEDKKALAESEVISLSDRILPRPTEKLVFGKPITAKVVDGGSFENKTEGSTARIMNGAVLRTAGLSFLPDGSEPHPLRVTEGDGIYLIADLGSEQAGQLSFAIDLPEEAEILIGWGEHLADGKCPESPMGRVRTDIGGRNFTAVYLGKKGKNVFVSPFLRFGCRYLEVHIGAKEADVSSLALIPAIYPVKSVTDIVTADPVWNEIYRISVRTLRLCMHEHYEDCPWREQALYAMDSRNQMLCGYYAFGETRFALASLNLMASSLREDGMLELCSPARNSITIPSFTAVFLTSVKEYLDHSHDAVGTLKLLPTMIKIADTFLSRVDPKNGLIPCYPEQQYWNFYEWQSGLEGSISGHIEPEDMTYDAPLNAFVSIGLRSLSAVCRFFGRNEKAEAYEKAHLALNRSIDAAFFSEERGVYATYLDLNGNLSHYCELTNSLAAVCGAAKEERLASVLSALLEGNLIPVTLSYSIFKYDALLGNRVAPAKVFAEIRALWKRMLDDGATSFYETIEGQTAFGNAGSLCHGWSAVPVWFLHRYALNADPRVNGITGCRAETKPDPGVI